MSADQPPTEGENIESAIYEVSKSIDNLAKLLSDRLAPKEETVRVFLEDVSPDPMFDTLTLTSTTMQKLDPAYHWKIFAERVK